MRLRREPAGPASTVESFGKSPQPEIENGLAGNIGAIQTVEKRRDFKDTVAVLNKILIYQLLARQHDGLPQWQDSSPPRMLVRFRLHL